MQRLNLSLSKPVWLDKPADVVRLGVEVREFGHVAVDTETTGLDIIRDVPLFVGLATPKGRYALRTDSDAFDALSDFISDPNITKILHNTKFDWHMLENRGLKVLGPKHDTLVMAAMSDTSRSSKQLKDLNVSLYGADDPRALRYKDFKSTFGKVTKKKSAEELLKGAPLDKVVQYVTCDAWSTLQNYETLKKQLAHVQNWRGQDLWSLYLQYEVEFTDLLWESERVGTRLDVGELQRLKKEWTEEAQTLEVKFAIACGKPINIRSTPQLRQYFLIDRGLKSLRLTSGGEKGDPVESLDATTLAYWAKELKIEEAAMVLRYRVVNRLVTTYCDSLLESVDAKGRVHTTLNQVGAETGRLSAENPPLHQIPVRTKDGKKIRKCFIADDGMVLIVRDYDQLEMKLTAGLSGDENMIAICNAGKDIHSGNASIAFGKPYEDIMEAVRKKDLPDELKELLTEYDLECLEDRRKSKTIGFGTLYGEGLLKLAIQLGFDVSTFSKKREAIDKAREVRAQFFAPFQKVSDFVDRTHREVEKNRCVQTLLGRFRALPAGSLLKTPAYYEAQRQSFNTKVQGSAADVVKLAMLKIRRDPFLKRVGARQLLQVHDEIMLECPTEFAKDANERFANITENWNEGTGLTLPVRLTTTGKQALNWADAK